MKLSKRSGMADVARCVATALGSAGIRAVLQPVEYRIKGTVVSVLSAADSCRDRLVVFYHWNDRQALKVAVSIARRHRVNLTPIRKWSEHEGALSKFEEFMTEVERRAGRRPGRNPFR